MNCDRIAPLYRWIEYAVFGRALERRRTAFLRDVSTARRVLALGDGDGRALAALLAAAPEARVDYVDASARMLELARTRAGSDRVNYHHADARFSAHASGPGNRPPALTARQCAQSTAIQRGSGGVLIEEGGAGEPGYDLIVTHFFLDCFDGEELRNLIERTARAAAPGARWIVSEFRPATLASRVLIAIMYAFFRKATGLATRRLADHHPHFLRNGFRLERVEEAWSGTLASEIWVRRRSQLDRDPEFNYAD